MSTTSLSASTANFVRLAAFSLLLAVFSTSIYAQSDVLTGNKSWDKPVVILTSANGMYEFRYEENGNVSLYMFYKEMNFATNKEEDRFSILWNTRIKGTNNTLIFENGELKIVQKGKRIWTNGVVTNEPTKMMLTNMGNLLIVNAAGVPLWDTGTYRVN